MNYLAQGIQQGAEIGARAYQERKRREQDTALEKARRELQLDLDAKRRLAEKALQDDRITADATRQFSDQEFRREQENSGRIFTREEAIAARAHDSEKTTEGRRFQRTMQKDAQEFQENESLQNRTDAGLRQRDALAADARKFDATYPLHQQELTLKRAALEWDKDPTNPRNQLTTERADGQREKNQMFADDGGGLGNLQSKGDRKAKEAAAATKLTPADIQALTWARANPNDARAKRILENPKFRQ
jgi:hypothetical protein